jgi:hypothetical protein
MQIFSGQFEKAHLLSLMHDLLDAAKQVEENLKMADDDFDSVNALVSQVIGY